jgi:hypothetical protein
MRYPLPLVRSSAVRPVSLSLKMRRPAVAEEAVVPHEFAWVQRLLDSMAGDDDTLFAEHVVDTGQTLVDAPGYAGSQIADWSLTSGFLGTDVPESYVGVTWDTEFATANQFIEGKYRASLDSTELISLGVRFTDVDGEGYVVECFFDDATTFHLILYRNSPRFGAEFNKIIGETTATVDPTSFRVLLVAALTRLRVLVDDALVIEATDEDITQIGGPLMYVEAKDVPAPRDDLGVDYVRAGVLV